VGVPLGRHRRRGAEAEEQGGVRMTDAYTMDIASTAVSANGAGPPTPIQIRDRLLKVLEQRCQGIETLERWYDGEHPLPSPPERMTRYDEAANAFRDLSRMGVTNYVSLVPDAPADRLEVTGFRFGDPANARNDDEAWTIWQRNHLDADSRLVQHKALVAGNAFVLVWPADGQAKITVEHPGQAIVAYAPGSRRQRAAGLKCWLEDDETRRVVLYLPDNVYKWANKSKAAPLEEWQPETDDTWPIANPFGEVPLVEFRANADLRPRPYGGGASEFAGVLPIQARINKTVFDRLVTAEFQAFRQRWAVGWTPDDPNEGMQASMRHLLTFEDPGVTVGEFAQADFSGFIKAVESDVQSMAAITRTPTFYTLGSISNISGDTLAALQAGLVAKCEAHRDNFSEDWEEVLRLGLKAEENERAGDESSMVVWRSIEHVTWAEIADAAAKLSLVGVPREALWAMLKDVSPQDIERWKVMQADEELFAPQIPEVPQGVAGAGQ
jgi:hypothetical protein